MESARCLPTCFVAALLIAAAARAQVTVRASVDSSEAQALFGSNSAAMSADGRFVAFQSAATNLVPGDTNDDLDVFVRDLHRGTTERVSVDSSGAEANGVSSLPAISADGRFVVFQSTATNLVAGDTNGFIDVFLRDRLAGTTERMSVGAGGVQANHESRFPAISGDGDHVAFLTAATNLVLGDTNGFILDTVVRDRTAAITVRVNVDSAGVQANDRCNPFVAPAISTDGRYVAFTCDGSNLVPGDANAESDVFVHDRQTGVTERVSVGPGGVEADRGSIGPSISGDGRLVAYWSDATNLVPGDGNGYVDVFVRDRSSGTTARASVATNGTEGDQGSVGSAISADGRFVAFYSLASNLVGGDTNGVPDVFVHERATAMTARASIDSSGAQANAQSSHPSISGDGRRVGFWSESSNLVPGDTNGNVDVFVRDRAASGFTSSCEPGIGGVIACPCANPPSGPGRGCDNSSGTGGAVLSASGIAYLASDSLVFTTSGERPTALSLLAQWNGGSSTGVVFGMGIRCTAGTAKRLFSRNAVGGCITVPDFGAGDPSVTARSASQGDTILPGQSRWYVVQYRDSTVLGGCPAASTFNATPTGKVTWSP